MKKTLGEVGDSKIRGRIINKMRFMDDTTILVRTPEELQDTANK